MAQNLFKCFGSAVALSLVALALLLVRRESLPFGKPDDPRSSSRDFVSAAPTASEEIHAASSGLLPQVSEIRPVRRPAAESEPPARSTQFADQAPIGSSGGKQNAGRPAAESEPLARSTQFADQAPNGSSGGKQYAGRQAPHPQVSTPAGLPFTFAIPEGKLAIGSPEEEAVYQAQFQFTKELNSLLDADPGSPEYAAQWDKSAAIHDNQLRLILGGPRYVQLSALAMQAEQAARKD